MINVIKASAGSGKTYQLTYEYIKLLLGEKCKGRYRLAKGKERHRHILAVTFTNKATGEMKERIVKELSILAGNVPSKSSSYMKDLCREFGGVSEDDVKAAAYKALVELLMDYTNFNVSTIDSFFQMILRSFAKELKMSYNYDVELDDKYAIKVGVNDFLSSVAFDKKIKVEDANLVEIKKKRLAKAKGWIREFVRAEVSSNNSNWNIFAKSEGMQRSYSSTFTFNDFADSLLKEELQAKIKDIIEYLGYEDENKEPNEYISKFREYLKQSIDELRLKPLEEKNKILSILAEYGFDEDVISGTGGLQWIKKITDNYFEEVGNIKISTYENTINRSDKWITKSKLKKGTSPLLAEADLSRVNDCIDRIITAINKYFIYKDLYRNVYMLGLLGEISHYLTKFREENDLILLADTNELLRKIINNEDMPFVYERVGIWLNHFLIDEFQDTSRSQWDNMRSLLYNSCAEGNDNLIIGDEKQCIYRFRNADPTLLRTDVSSQYTVKQNDSGKCINWRSAPNVVNFNNELFAAISSQLKCSEEYANLYQELPTPDQKKYNNKGYVEVNFIEESGTKNDEGEEDNSASGSNSVESGDTENLKFKQKVLEQLPFLIKDIKSRGYGYSDIAILVNMNKEGAEVINSILSYNNNSEDVDKIPVVSSDSLLLCNSSAVRLIVSHLRYLDSKILVNYGDKKKEMEGYVHRVLRNYDSLMLDEGKDPGEAIAESFETVPLETPQEDLALKSLLPEKTESFNIISITEHIIAQNIRGKLLNDENAFVQAFQDCVIEFSNRPNPTIHEFLKWWDRGGYKTSICTPEGQDAINVVTIHKSKGLEYKCVILPICNWDMAGKEEILWLSKEDMIASNLFSGIPNELIPPVMPIKPNKLMQLDKKYFNEFVEAKLHERYVDQLNKTYVAFTRAVDELYIFTPEVNEGGQKTTKLNGFLKDSLSVDNKFIKGEKGTQKVKATADVQNEDKMPLYRVNNIELKYVVDDMVTNEQREKGTRLHNVFKRIKYIDDVDVALHYCKVKGIIPIEEFDDDVEIVKKALSDTRVQEWFNRNNKVYNERSLVFNKEKSRPDRVVVTPEGRTIVVDYKFGKIHSTDYIEQVQDYMNYLADMGFENIEGYLWYPLECKIQRVKKK